MSSETETTSLISELSAFDLFSGGVDVPLYNSYRNPLIGRRSKTFSRKSNMIRFGNFFVKGSDEFIEKINKIIIKIKQKNNIKNNYRIIN